MCTHTAATFVRLLQQLLSYTYLKCFVSGHDESSFALLWVQREKITRRLLLRHSHFKVCNWVWKNFHAKDEGETASCVHNTHACSHKCPTFEQRCKTRPSRGERELNRMMVEMYKSDWIA